MNAERLAIVVDPTLPLGIVANTVATIGIGLGAASPEFGATLLTDAMGRAIHNSANRPVPILQAAPDVIQGLLMKALPPPEKALVVAFPRFARTIHSFADYQSAFAQRDLAAETIEGLGLSGPDKWVRSLTGSLKLLR